MAPLRTAFCAALLAASHADEGQDPLDGVSLLQALSVKGVARNDKKSVGALLETAGSLLKNGATEDVIEFASATLEEISGIVIPAIRNASESDQRLLNFMYARFEAALAELEEGNQRIHQLNEQRNTLSTQHKHCRDEEAVKCDHKVTCDYHLWDLWKIFIEEERDLRIIEGSIDGHFCVQDEDGYYIANGTLWHFRDQSVPYMTSFIAQKERVDIAEENYGDYVPECEHKWTVLDDQTDVCDAYQLQLERAACSHAVAIRDVQNTFAEAWNHALFSYNLTVHEVKLQEIDRISEYRTLSVVQCLLDRTRERNGRPCDESTDEITEEVTHCEQVRVTTDITWLQLIYHIVEPHPLPCPDRHQVVGRCWPEVPSWPCQAQYINEEYASLPDVPMPVFSETNSHCNPRPDCESCTITDEPDVHLCTSQWSLTHYELCADTHTTPAPPPSNIQAPPAVCPAGWEQKGEAGADIGGCGLQSCDERYDITSEAACAARCDQHSACVGFSYAPMNGDRNHPGVTACTIYNSDIPTGTWTGTEGLATQVFCGREPQVDCGPVPPLTHAEWVSNLNGASQYRCNEGFSFDGTALAHALIFEIECQANGLWSAVHACVPINDCPGHSCGAFGTCRDEHMDYTCDCMEGYEMTIAEDGEKICGNIDDCDGHLCGAAGVCVDLVSDYECHCQDGWEQVVMEITDVKTCERIECGPAPQIPNTVSTTSDIWHTTTSGIFPWTRGKAVFEEMIEYMCLPGYSVNGLIDGAISFTIMCQADGEYTAAQECLPISCGAPGPAGSATPLSEEVLHFGQSVQYACPEGHGPEFFQRTCMENGQFSAYVACEPKLCPPPPLFPHAELPSGDLYFFGQSAEYRCMEGYSTSFDGPSGAAFEIECLGDDWAVSSDACVPIQCEVHPDVSHASTDSFFIYYHGINIIFCAEGYTVDGTAGGATELSATCQSNGIAELAPCRIVTCSGDDLEMAPNADVTIQDHTLGSVATYTCHEGHAVANTFATTFDVRCQRNGLFSALSTCRNIDDCDGHSCGSNGRCIDGINDYSCECEDGFEEVEKICGNIDDCGPGACGGNGACHDLVNGYQCECDLGYVLQGSGEDQICVPEICTFPAWENVIPPDVTELYFPHGLFVECMDGYDLGEGGSKGRSFFAVECGAGGVLTSGGSTAIPVCVPKVCGTPPNVGAEVVEIRDYFFGETAISVCQGGDVTITHECGADGQFIATSEFQTCRNQCDGLVVPEHASLTGGSIPLTHPDVATFTCHTGFTPLPTGEPGPPFSQACRANGQFEALTVGAGGCVPVVCERPSLPPHWEFVDGASDFNFVTGVRLRCSDGFQSDLCGADGTYRLACGDDGHAADLPPACEENTYHVEGRVRNAVNPTQTVPHATVVIGGQTVTTDASGYYSVHLTAGTHQYSVSANNYISVESASVTITTHAVFDIIISPVLAADSWRIVLEWTDQPLDLDSHLVFSGHEWSCDEVYYGYPRSSCNGVSAHLDWDETQGWGPETVTIDDVNNCQANWYRTCKYVYKVKNFSGWWHMSQEGWVRSNAKVRLYNGENFVREFNVNDGDGFQASDGGFDFSHQETDYYWSVFSIDGDGNVQACTSANC